MISKTRLFAVILIFFSAWSLSSCQTANDDEAKYVFFFIGDGMGFEQVNLTQAFMSAKEGENGNTHLSFTQFPVTGMSTTYADGNYITCSAAAATALSTGTKTQSGTLGLAPNHSDTLISIAYPLHNMGYNVGVSTSVSIDHATPAGFYARQSSRYNYHEIAHDMVTAGFRFFAGGNFIDPDGEESESPLGNVTEAGEQNGFLFTHDFVLSDSLKSAYKSIVYTPSTGQTTLNYRIDADEDAPQLADITAMGIDVLHDEKSKGFFMMVEGGKIDWACHDNDAATVLGEMIAFSDAIEVAVRFYNKYPDNTLIVVTADHETGGLAFGNNVRAYNNNIEFLAKQNVSRGNLSSLIEDKVGNNASLAEVMTLLEEMVGLDTPEVELSADDKELIRKAYRVALGKGSRADAKQIEKSYGGGCPLTLTAIGILNDKAGVGWTTRGHTGGQVPVYAIGAGQEQFSGQMDNTEFSKRIAKAMGVEL